MKKEDLQRTTAYSSSYATKLQERETVLEKFTYWIRNFLESAE
jgi:hypothetical protein